MIINITVDTEKISKKGTVSISDLGSIFIIDMDKLKQDGKLSIRGFGTFRIKPRKKGASFNGLSKTYSDPKYSKRLSFHPSPNIKDTLCQ